MSRPRVLGLLPSFGFGDRIGLATPGHVAALRRAGSGIAPIFAQQSIREMTRTGRSPEQVLADADRGQAESGYDGPCGADADHLKTPADVDRTAAAGFVFFTIDPSEHVDAAADGYAPSELRERARAAAEFAPWVEAYRGRTVRLAGGVEVVFDEAAVLRAAVKYGRAIHHALALARHVDAVQRAAGRDYEIELSVDETPHPTTLAEHFIIAEQCLRQGMKLVSLAPRLLGEFEKGVDFKGDRTALARSLTDHAAVAAALGPYKLSLHSGSDKLSMYAALARTTGGRFHVKTAGTSYLEALRVAARHDAALFRRIVEFARSRYDADKATYHVSATLASAPPPGDVPDDRALEGLYLGHWSETPLGAGFVAPGRQILHCTFGSVLTDAALGGQLRQLLLDHAGTHREILAEHFARHLSALQAGL